MTLLDRYVLILVSQRTLVVAGAVYAVLVGGQGGLLAGRGVPLESLPVLILPLVLFSTPFVLPLALSSALLVTLGGMHRDGELQALAAAGVRPTTAIRSLWILVLVAAVGAGLLSHLVLPRAMADLRDSKERFLSAAIGQRVADRKPINLGEGVQVWADGAEGGRMSGVTVRITNATDHIVAFAPKARWIQAEDDFRFTMFDVVAVRVEGSAVTTIRLPEWTLDQLKERGPRTEPDTMSTAELWLLVGQQPGPGEHWGTYNNARLNLELRLFLPLVVAALAIFAAGLGVIAGISETLVAVGLMAALTVTCIYPAIGYTKTGIGTAKIDPAWILAPPLLVTTVIGLRFLLRAGRPGTLLGKRG